MTLPHLTLSSFSPPSCPLPSCTQIRLHLFGRNDICAAIMRVDRDYEGTGMAGFGTNKGGVAIGVRVWDTELCFVNSHLAAHQDQVRAWGRGGGGRDMKWKAEMGTGMEVGTQRSQTCTAPCQVRTHQQAKVRTVTPARAFTCPPSACGFIAPLSCGSTRATMTPQRLLAIGCWQYAHVCMAAHLTPAHPTTFSLPPALMALTLCTCKHRPLCCADRCA